MPDVLLTMCTILGALYFGCFVALMLFGAYMEARREVRYLRARRQVRAEIRALEQAIR